jgi:hypothetical protein
MAMRISSRQTPGSRVECFDGKDAIALQNAVRDGAPPFIAELDLDFDESFSWH